MLICSVEGIQTSMKSYDIRSQNKTNVNYVSVGRVEMRRLLLEPVNHDSQKNENQTRIHNHSILDLEIKRNLEIY